ncbi:restriction endonuclease subunit S [Campylobacter sp. CX2-8023-23]|nr:restriction endonuclease subunit S [Campylobacter sp. CX2-8023-23]
MRIPVPPLEVQCEIVRILDNFTLLSAELSARQKQFEYYKNYLLKSYDRQDNACLKDIAEYSKDRIKANELNEDNYIGVDNLLQNKQGKVKSSYIPKEGNFTKYQEKDILIGNIRPYLKKIWFADNVGGTNGDVLAIRITDNNVIPEYLYFILSSDKFFNYDNSNSKGAKMPRGNKEAVMNYKFYLPSKDEQLKIVNKLNKFEIICNDISQGLPAEIEARQKQYEYYRDKLLAFKELKVDE